MDGEIRAERLRPTMSSRRLQIVEFVERFWAQRGVGPTTSETANAVGVTRSRAQKLVTRLVRDGQLERIDGMTRGVRPVGALARALKQLREAGYVVDEDVLSVIEPPPPLLDLDALGALILIEGRTSSPLPGNLRPPYRRRGGGRTGGQGDEDKDIGTARAG